MKETDITGKNYSHMNFLAMALFMPQAHDAKEI